MSNEVFANGNEIACKSGDGKVIAAFPDVCLSPPSPPAGPIPVPYPDTSLSKDTQNGSRTVKIDGKEVMLKDRSFYKTAPLGDEAATNGLGASVITHVITGKTYFVAWSMDVKFEGLNVDRHVDLTTSNHASYPGSTPPFTNLEQLALERIAQDKCPCCGKGIGACPSAYTQTFANGAQREPLSFREFYRLDEPDASGALTPTAASRRAELAANPCLGSPCPNAGKAEPKSDPPCDVYRVTTKAEADEATKNKYVDKEIHRDQHQVPKTKGAIEKFFKTSPTGKLLGTIDKPKWDSMTLDEKNKSVQIDHTTPRAAGGCPDSTNNTVAHARKCANCKALDSKLDSWQSVELQTRRAALGI